MILVVTQYTKLFSLKYQESEFEDKLTVDEVYAAVSPVILTSGENARTIKYKIQQVIEELLFKDIQRKLDGAK